MSLKPEDLELAKRNPENTLQKRAIRTIDAQIAEYQEKIDHLRFIREVVVTLVEK